MGCYTMTRIIILLPFIERRQVGPIDFTLRSHCSHPFPASSSLNIPHLYCKFQLMTLPPLTCYLCAGACPCFSFRILNPRPNDQGCHLTPPLPDNTHTKRPAISLCTNCYWDTQCRETRKRGRHRENVLRVRSQSGLLV